jgi:hypothetical protein
MAILFREGRGLPCVEQVPVFSPTPSGTIPPKPGPSFLPITLHKGLDSHPVFAVPWINKSSGLPGTLFGYPANLNYGRFTRSPSVCVRVKKERSEDEE